MEQIASRFDVESDFDSMSDSDMTSDYDSDLEQQAARLKQLVGSFRI